MATGVIVKCESFRGFGWIRQDGADLEDVFFHVTAWPVGEGPPMVRQRVSFSVEDAGRGPRATDVEVLEGGA